MNLWLPGVGKGWRDGIVKRFGVDMYTLLYLKWITSEDLLYSTGNCLMLCRSLDGRGVWGRMDTCVCMAESLCCPPETITTLLISYVPKQNKKLKIYIIFYNPCNGKKHKITNLIYFLKFNMTEIQLLPLSYYSVTLLLPNEIKKK